MFSTPWANLPLMRWERLFADLESGADDAALVERDALIADLREGEWAATSWWQLCGGPVELGVVGLGRVVGEAVAANESVIQVRTSHEHVLINVSHVLDVRSSRRAAPLTAVASRLGLPHALRMCQRDGDRVRLHRVDSSQCVGTVQRVGRDFVDIRDDSGRLMVVPLSAVAALSCPL